MECGLRIGPALVPGLGQSGLKNLETARRVIARVLTTRAPLVLATGGGAFMNPETRERVGEQRGLT